jgi:hypothetical protein
MSDDIVARRLSPHIRATTQMAAARVAASTYGLDRAGAVSADEMSPGRHVALRARY